MKYPIRNLDISDYDEMVSLWQQSGLQYRPYGRDSRESLAREFKRKETCFLGMYDGKKLIGTIIGTSDGRRGWINRLAVDPDYRGRGLAGELIAAAEEFLCSLGLKIIAALVEDWNAASMSAITKANYLMDDGVIYYSKRESKDT